MNSRESLIKQRDCFRKLAEGIDEMIAIDEREAAGENKEVLEKEMESLVGRYILLIMELESLK